MGRAKTGAARIGDGMILPAIEQFFRAHWVELAGFVTTAVGIWLTTKRLLICWPVVLAADILYLIVFYRPAFSPTPCCKSSSSPSPSTAGGTGGAASTKKAKSAWSRSAPAICLVLAIVAGSRAASSSAYSAKRLHAALPYLDATLTSFSLVGSWWQARNTSPIGGSGSWSTSSTSASTSIRTCGSRRCSTPDLSVSP